jgi:hypothetical protein
MERVVDEEAGEGGWFWNEQVGSFRPPGALYCRECGVLIEEYDHLYVQTKLTCLIHHLFIELACTIESIGCVEVLILPLLCIFWREFMLNTRGLYTRVKHMVYVDASDIIFSLPLLSCSSIQMPLDRYWHWSQQHVGISILCSQRQLFMLL